MKPWTTRGGNSPSSSCISRIVRRTSRYWSSESRIWNVGFRLASPECSRRMRWQMPWKVPIHSPEDGICSNSSTRPRISLAALLVKVTASTDIGETCSTWISQAIRWTRTRVLPEPAPASTRQCPSSSVTAWRWASFRSSMRWETSIDQSESGFRFRLSGKRTACSLADSKRNLSFGASRQRAVADVGAVVNIFKADLGQPAIEFAPGLGQRVGHRGDAKHPAAVGHDPVVLQPGAGVEHLDLIGPIQIQAGDRIAHPVLVRVAAGGHHDADGRTRIPVEL